MDPEDPDSHPDDSQKFNHFFLLPFLTYPENFIKIYLSVFELSRLQTNRGPKMTLGQVLWRSVDDLQ